MKVVSNTSPLLHAILIGKAEIFPSLFGELSIPPAVAEELHHPNAPPTVRSWLQTPPIWLQIHPMQEFEVPGHLAKLNRGETEAILLAQQLRADLILLDEKAARRAATELQLEVMGLLGALEQAGREGLLDLKEAMVDLQESGFYLSPKLIKMILQRHGA